MVSCTWCKTSFEKNQKVAQLNGKKYHRACYALLVGSKYESDEEDSDREDTTAKSDEKPYISTYSSPYSNQTSGEAWECENCGMKNTASTKWCSSCEKQRYTPFSSVDRSTDASNIEDEYGNSSLHDYSETTHDYDYEKSTKKALKDDYDNHGSDSDTQDNDYYHKKLREDNIKPKHNDYTRGNRMSHVDPEQSPPTFRKTSIVKEVKPRNAHSSHSPSNSQRVHVVYIPDLPSDMVDNLQLEQVIRRRIEDILDIELRSVKCYSKLGLGVIQVVDSQFQDRLIKIGKLALDPKDTKYFITFTDNIELVSYLVLEVPEELKDVTLPSTKDIARRWTDLHNGDEPSACDALNAQFPNIYRIVSTSVDTLIDASSNDVLKIKSFLAHVYYCADCSFFEDLPRSITKNQLEDSIAADIGQSNISSTSLYIDINKRAATACIIVADRARLWCTKSHISIGKNVLSKKTALSCRLLIHPVPKSLPIQSIINHPELNGAVTNHKQNGDHLIVEISDENVFQRCLKQGGFHVDKQHTVHVDLCSTLINPEESEIDADTWYEADMVKYSPDIMQFVANPQHPIFLYRWNSQIWLQQFKSVATQKRDNNRSILHNPKSPTPDQQRHQLRVTVMLNTLGVIRKRSYMIGDQEVKLNLKKELKTIVYDHRSKLERPEKMPLKKTPYPETTVHVVPQDCLVAYQNMITSGKRPLLLNMASATSPGGGFRKGVEAQEENIFRRSDYSRSLDVDLDEFFQQQPQRLRCSSDCKFEPMSARDKMYPMNEFGAIYTSGITVFRQSEDSGYAFMENPLEDVCAIAMAAYRDPELKGNMLAPKYAVGTRKKIENIFAIAHHHKHDSLVLSAFGCGAFKNPPDHIVKLFQSVIEQYAGFFKSIVFAIVDDHNAGRQLNPEGNFQPFASVLGEGIIVQPNTSMNRPNTIIGPYRLLSDGLRVNDVSILDLNPCHYGAKCNQIYDPQHSSQFAHPPLCIEAVVSGNCKSLNDPVHMSSFIHRNQCRNSGDCLQINDEKHNREFEHPDYCLDEGKCQNQQEDHLRQYRHLPFCNNSHRCMDFQKQVPEHCRKYRHCAPRCPHGNQCIMFHDKAHLVEFQHPFPPPCQQTPFDCSYHRDLTGSKNISKLSTTIQQHCLDFAHVCIWGRNCTDKTTLHSSKSIHIARHMCSYDGRCNKLNDEDHLNSFTHSRIPDIRPSCLHSDKCRDRHKVDHKLQFRHPTYSEDGVVQYYGSNEHTNFVQNQKDNIDCINDYITTQKWKPLPSGSIRHEILNWLRNVQPIHRCSPTIFESILLHGHVMSREYMGHLKDPKFVAYSVFQHSRIRHIEDLKKKTLENDAREYITALVHQEFEKSTLSSTTSGPPPSIAPTPGTHGSLSTSKPYSMSEHYANIIKQKENKLSDTISVSDMKALRTKAIEIAQASIKLHSNPAGIGYAPDKALRADKLVFSVLGPHLGHYYGDVIIIFKRKILHHPDANFSIQSATSFASGQSYRWRPWLGSDPGSTDERGKFYHRAKLHAAVPGYDYAAALELIALASLRLKIKTMDIDLQQILDEWVKVDSHQNIEAHLPQLIPLDYIDHIYIPKNLFSDLSEDALKAIDAICKDRITVVPHAGEANQEKGPSGPTPTLKSRSDYQNSVVQDLLNRYKQYAAHSSLNPINGFMITIPSTMFNDHYIIPLTISQAYAQYRTQHTYSSKDNIIYIYWKALHGDMMLTLSNEEIDPEEKQLHLRCLICYVAPRSTSNDNQYHEQTSYLTAGNPFEHAIIINRKAYKTKSNTFYTGCDSNNFISYCLEIHRSTGTTTLSHAGPNAVYNHEEMSCVFNKSELDLSKLEYIHVSAGADTVSIQNLMICFEKQPDWHPTFDKNYKRSDSSMPVDQPVAGSASASIYTSHIAHENSSLKSVNNSISESPSIIHQLKRSVLGKQDSSLEPCPQNVNCLLQYSEDGGEHNGTFSHPCRYSELCRENEPHLTHEPNPVPRCKDDKKCADLVDPLHRASYRHTDLPDFLIPCRHQKKCYDTSRGHRMRWSHGEQVYQVVALSMPKTTNQRMRSQPRTQQERHSSDEEVQCKWGAECWDQSTSHRNQYSHSSTTKLFAKKDDHRVPYEWGDQDQDGDSEHRAKYSHPSATKPSAKKDDHRISYELRDQDHDSDNEHQGKYLHLLTTKTHMTKDDSLPPCKWGDQDHDSDSEHRAKYSHPSATKPSVKKDDHRIPYELRDQDHDSDSEHRVKYSHPSTTKSHVTKDDRRNPCKWGNRCRDNDSEHRRRYSHPD